LDRKEMKEKKVVDIDVVVFKGVTKTTTQQNKNKKTEYVCKECETFKLGVCRTLEDSS
jgi:CRISPR/Cas system type I-B associated protein Csh2 (Cas7 group RAMP superfamily)